MFGRPVSAGIGERDDGLIDISYTMICSEGDCDGDGDGDFCLWL